MNTINAALKSDDPRGRILSNLSAHGFLMDGIKCESVEAFIQGIKFPVGDVRREQTFALVGLAAWRMRVQAEGKYVWWGGEAIVFRSREHFALIRRAIQAKFSQNPEALEALIATKGLTIVHNTGVEESLTTSLPAVMYCQILTDIRESAT